MADLPPIGSRVVVWSRTLGSGADEVIGYGTVTGHYEQGQPFLAVPEGSYAIVRLDGVDNPWYAAGENITYLDIPDRTDLAAVDTWLG